MRRWLVLGLLVPGLAGCHVLARSEVTRPGTTQRIRHAERAQPQRPTLVLTDAGSLRFVEPLACPTELVGREQRSVEIARRPNLATFVVGVIATAVGGVLVVRGVTDGDGVANPFTYAGAGLVAVGAPLMIGPWIGTTTELQELPAGEPVRQPGPSEACGERPLAATTATLAVRGIEMHGAVDHDGVFAVSPFQLVDAFDPTAIAAWSIAARVDAPTGARTVDVVIDGAALAARARAFLAAADFEARIEPMRVVPNVVAGTLRVSLTSTSAGPVVRLVLPLRNDGPGPAWALRGHVLAPGTPAIDGRILYVGPLAKGAAITRELLIPITRAAAEDIRNATLDISVELRDAHGTAPTTPVRFRGAVLADAPRS